MARSVKDAGWQDKKSSAFQFFIFILFFNVFSGESDAIKDRILHPSTILLL